MVTTTFQNDTIRSSELIRAQISDYLSHTSAEVAGAYGAVSKNGGPRAINIELSEKFSQVIRTITMSDSLVMVVRDDSDAPQSHTHGTFAMGPPQGYTYGKSGIIGIEIGCSEFARLAVRIFEEPRLHNMLDGLVMLAEHELGHIKAELKMASSGAERHGMLLLSDAQDVWGTESIARDYAVSRIEGNGGRERVVSAFAAAQAMDVYLSGRRGAIREETAALLRHHQNDSEVVNNLGIARQRYNDRRTVKEVTAKAKGYLAELEAVLGGPA